MTDRTNGVGARRRGLVRRAAAAAIVAGFASMVTFSSVNALAPSGEPSDTVTLCHATASASNPYVMVSVNAAAAFNGHLGAGHQNGEDIIPPFMFQGVTHSQNWDAEGMAIFNNNCAVPATTTTTTASSSTTAPPSTAATSTTSTASSTTAVESTTTAVPGSSTSAPPTSTGRATTTTGQVATTAGTLPPTGGRPDGNVIAGAAVLLVAGGLALAFARRRTA